MSIMAQHALRGACLCAQARSYSYGRENGHQRLLRHTSSVTCANNAVLSAALNSSIVL